MENIDPTSIKPHQRGKAGFYSWQLYRWVKERPHYCQIWRGTWNCATGVDPTRPTLWVGTMDTDPDGRRWFHGSFLPRLCTHGQALDAYAYGPCFDTAHWTDITDQWWQEYHRIGVCAIHAATGAAHRWDERNGERECLNCGVVEQRVVEMVPQTRWVPAPQEGQERC